MTVKETFKTESGSIQASGSRTISRSFMVFPYTDWADANTAMDTDVPINTTYTIGTETATYSGTKSWSRVEGQKGVWSFSLEFTTEPNIETSTAVIETQGDTRATTKDVYRVGFDIPSSWDEPTKDDILGQHVDSGGTPTTIVWLDRRFETVAYVSSFPQLNALSDMVGKRNLEPYEGGESGTVLYLGFSWSYNSSNELWAIRHQFSVDRETYHTEQVAKTDASGKVIPKLKVEGSQTYYTAKHVYIVQPFAAVSFFGLPDFP